MPLTLLLTHQGPLPAARAPTFDSLLFFQPFDLG